MKWRNRRIFEIFGVLGLLGTAATGCVLFDFISVKTMYTQSRIDASKVRKDIPYREGADADPKKHRLDLYLPDGRNWPVLVFVHGGGWDSGDKNLTVTGSDIYANIGRFYAAHGIGTAVINYRLLPDVTWPEQIRDVAGAVAWVHRRIASFGGDPKRLYLSGHSAGAQLVTRVALDPAALKAEGLSKNIVAGVIAVSGAGYHVEGKSTLATQGARNDYFARRFRGDDETGAWAREISVLRFVDKSAPPFLVLYGTAEPMSLRQQSQLLAERLGSVGVAARLEVVPHRDHIQMAMTMSQENSQTAKAVLETIKK